MKRLHSDLKVTASCNPMTLTFTLELTLTTVLLSFDHVALLMESLLLKVLDARVWSNTQNQKNVHVRIMQTHPCQKIEQAFILLTMPFLLSLNNT